LFVDAEEGIGTRAPLCFLWKK